ncbi:DUF4304 domain-containing protein [Agromyces sp. MMS24-JH15]|uniref:DUF4304 domain-containing protein n=1 Tax=Agromyces sp. MMS24-JH15 TaxID=3243765 RepID=UPI003749863E
MTAQQGLRTALKEILGPAVRAAGYRGSGTTWRKANEHGDLAIVKVQSSMFSSAGLLPCVVNLSLAPTPWVDRILEKAVRRPKTIGESYGMYRRRLHPTGAPPVIDTWWEITSEDAAADAVHDMVAQLRADGLPTLDRLLDRSNLLATIRAHDLGFPADPEEADLTPYFLRCEALILADEGDRAGVDRVLADLAAHPEPPDQQPDGFAEWVRERVGVRSIP